MIAGILFALNVAGSSATITINDCENNTDRDNDGLKACVEETLGTDPMHYDSDGDGVPDGYEVLNAFDPLVYDSHLDQNCDCITEWGHYVQGTDPWKRSEYDVNNDWCVNWDDIREIIRGHFRQNKYNSVFLQKAINTAIDRRNC